MDAEGGYVNTKALLSASEVNGKIYAIGGWANSPLSTVEAYDPVTDTWERKADVPTIIHKHATSVVNGKIYVIGGSNGIDTGCKVKSNRIMNIPYRIRRTIYNENLPNSHRTDCSLLHV